MPCSFKRGKKNKIRWQIKSRQLFNKVTNEPKKIMNDHKNENIQFNYKA